MTFKTDRGGHKADVPGSDPFKHEIPVLIGCSPLRWFPVDDDVNKWNRFIVAFVVNPPFNRSRLCHQAC